MQKPLPQADRNLLGRALWNQGKHADALVAVAGNDGARIDPSAWVFFRDTGQYKAALKLLTDPSARMPESAYENPWLYDEADLLARIGRLGDARAAYRGVIKSETQEAALHPDESHSVGALIDAQIALAELSGTAPAESSALARAVLADLPALKGQIGLTGQTREVLYYQARAHWLLGNCSQAKREMAACIALAPPAGTTPRPSDLLSAWNAASR